VNDETTYQDVMNNGKLMKALTFYLRSGLSNNPAESRWGCGIVSDFDLAENLQTDACLHAKLKALLGDDFLKHPNYEVLRKNRKNVREFIHRIRGQVIGNFQLPETPDPNLKKRKIVEKKAKTPEELVKKVNEQLDKASKEVSNLI
jgi:hypothetical protein